MIILGTPASGKTTLAARLAADLKVPCICKDDVKDALFDVLGLTDAVGSRRFSDASFAAQLRVGRRLLEAGLACMLEGNWRPEHGPALAALGVATGARLAQILCRCAPPELERRFDARVRHPGHADALADRAVLRRAAAAPPVFLDLPGPRWMYQSDMTATYPRLLQNLETWRV